MRFRDESGATLVTVAITLTLLMGAAAVAIDLSAGWNERRQDQTAADLSVMSGALSFSFGNRDPVVEEAMATARLNVDSEFSDADWDSLWQACADSYPGYVGITHSTLGYMDCIGINSATGLMRVRIPDQEVAATFGRLLGFDFLTTHAGAVARLFEVGGSGALPFAVRGGATAGLLCLDNGPPGTTVDPCTGPEKGSFGNIAPPLFGNPSMNTSPDCTGQGSGENVAAAIAMGMDHNLYTLASIPGSSSDTPSNNTVDGYSNMDECVDEGGDFATPGDGDPINGVYVDTGNNAKADSTLGLVTGNSFPDGGPARLRRVDPACDPLAGCKRVRNVDGYLLDNTPLWFHLLDSIDWGMGNPPIAECDRASYYDGITYVDTDAKTTAIWACLANYALLTDPDDKVQIFANSIVDNNPRLGVAPGLWHDNLGSGLTYRAIKRFELVYLNGLWFDDFASQSFRPDDQEDSSISLSNWKDVEQVTAFLLEDAMVSQYVLDTVGKTPIVTFEPTLYE